MRSEFKLESPGVSVRWHPQDPMKVGGEEGGRNCERGKRRGPREGRERGSFYETVLPHMHTHIHSC